VKVGINVGDLDGSTLGAAPSSSADSSTSNTEIDPTDDLIAKNIPMMTKH
jgi:hypothetical protein